MNHRLPCLCLIAAAALPCTGAAQVDDSEGAWANFDFVPGDSVMFIHDFEGTPVGNFPSRLEYLEGNMEVVELPDGNQALRTQNEGRFEIPLGAEFPDRFTVELRMRTNDAQGRASLLLYSGGDDATRKSPAAHPVVFASAKDGVGITTGKYNEGPKAVSEVPDGTFIEEWGDVRIAVDAGYWKVYADEKRVSNIPTLDFPEGSSLRVYMSIYPYDGRDLYLDDIRVAKGGPRSLYEDLVSEGRIVTRGVYFEVGDSAIMPESTPTLREIKMMMGEHPDLRVRVEGHTDDTGSDDLNQTLSEARADAVRRWLVERGISAERVETAGLGPSRPVADNATPEGRARNRRTEIWPVE